MMNPPETGRMTEVGNSNLWMSGPGRQSVRDHFV
jgi:hypothetical protein